VIVLVNLLLANQALTFYCGQMRMSGPRLDLRKATIGRLAQLYPACFHVARHQRRPLKIGVGRDLAALDLGIGRRELGSALAWYVNGIGYLQGLRVGADRIGLDGVPAGVAPNQSALNAPVR
jgi:ProP effector